jgi:hypothetical protein
MTEAEAATLIVVQNLCPDAFFTADQQQRQGVLMDRWRRARAQQTTLPAEEQAELEALVAAELEAAARRATALLSQLHIRLISRPEFLTREDS